MKSDNQTVKLEDVVFCFNCRKTPESDKKFAFCARCGIMSYCSKDCQVANWKTHKTYCNKLNRNAKNEAGKLYTETVLGDALNEIIGDTISLYKIMCVTSVIDTKKYCIAITPLIARHALSGRTRLIVVSPDKTGVISEKTMLFTLRLIEKKNITAFANDETADSCYLGVSEGTTKAIPLRRDFMADMPKDAKDCCTEDGKRLIASLKLDENGFLEGKRSVFFACGEGNFGGDCVNI
jgi:hypothetical protein